MTPGAVLADGCAADVLIADRVTFRVLAADDVLFA